MKDLQKSSKDEDKKEAQWKALGLFFRFNSDCADSARTIPARLCWLHYFDNFHASAEKMVVVSLHRFPHELIG